LRVPYTFSAGGAGDIIALGSGTQTDAVQMPHDLVFDRVYIHGDPVVGQKRGIALNSGYTEILNSYIADVTAAAVDSQAICGWNGSGRYLIENNYLEAADTVSRTRKFRRSGKHSAAGSQWIGSVVTDPKAAELSRITARPQSAVPLPLAPGRGREAPARPDRLYG
jgi:hypothetical protein